MKSGELQMNLRRKRNTASYQNEDHYNSYEQYEEVTKGGSRKEGQSRNDHGNLAKILIDFVSQINSNCRENKRLVKDKERKAAASDSIPEPRKRLKTEQNSEVHAAQARKNHPAHHAHQEKIPEKTQDKKYGNKELYRFKDQVTPNLRNLIPEAKSGSNPPSKVPIPSQPNILPNFSYMNFINEIGNQPFFLGNVPMNFANLTQIQSAMPGLAQGINPGMNPLSNMNFNLNMMLQPQFGDRIPPYQVPQEAIMRLGTTGGFAGMNAAGMGSIGGANPLDYMSALQQSKGDKNQTKLYKRDNKLFKRAAFHVAIAYHIHLKKIQQKDKDKKFESLQIDPTFHAKQLRQKKKSPEQNPTKSSQPSQNKADTNEQTPISIESNDANRIQVQGQEPEPVPVDPQSQFHAQEQAQAQALIPEQNVEQAEAVIITELPAAESEMQIQVSPDAQEVQKPLIVTQQTK